MEQQVLTGCCDTGPDDLGVHVICAQVTAEFLVFSRSRGNNLSTPRPEYGFTGQQPGDRWCLCAGRAARGGLTVATHEEWQRHADSTVTGRLGTVVFREQPGTPNGLVWVHVHETWLPESVQRRGRS